MDPRYPIGKPDWKSPMADADRASAIAYLGAFPQHLAAAVEGLSDAQLDTPYRDGGWTVRQVVHHLADSHINCYIRVRFALTEANPTIMPYDEAAWAELPDARSAPVALSLALLQGLHARWHDLLASLDAEARARTFFHPENGAMSIDQVIALYSWHCRHHLAHILNAPR